MANKIPKTVILENADQQPNLDWSKVSTLRTVDSIWQKKPQKFLPPLVLRVLHRSKVRFFGKIGKTDKWPFQVSVFSINFY